MKIKLVLRLRKYLKRLKTIANKKMKMGLMILKTLLNFKLKIRIKLIKNHPITYHLTKKNQRNLLVKTLVGVGEKQIIMIMMDSMISTRLKKLNKRVNGRHLEGIQIKKMKMRALKNYKVEQNLINLSLQNLLLLIIKLIKILML
jgi:hypothetical protein